MILFRTAPTGENAGNKKMTGSVKESRRFERSRDDEIYGLYIRDAGEDCEHASPSGCTKEVMEIIRREAENFGFQTEFNRKGGLIITVPGQTEHVLGFSAHVDTLGAMVRSVRSNGTLALTQIGGMMMEAIEGSYCQILTRDGRRFTGTIQTKEPSVHVWDDCKEFKRTEENMEVRLDEIVRTKEDVEQLGIGAGDFISFDPKFVITESGFVKSRHMDDKASAAVLLGLLKYVHDTGKKPEQTLKLLISNYEEVGHGCSYIPQDVEELIAVDMGCVGDDLNGDEYPGVHLRQGFQRTV